MIHCIVGWSSWVSCVSKTWVDGCTSTLAFVLPYKGKNRNDQKGPIFECRVQKFMNVLVFFVDLCDGCVIVSTMGKVWTRNRPDSCAAPSSGVSSVTSVHSWQECCCRRFQGGFHVVSRAAVWRIGRLLNFTWTILLDIDLISLTKNKCVVM